ncbi:hypothetical protein ACRRTK_015708 [Alexandromys fortis]
MSLATQLHSSMDHLQKICKAKPEGMEVEGCPTGRQSQWFPTFGLVSCLPEPRLQSFRSQQDTRQRNLMFCGTRYHPRPESVASEGYNPAVLSLMSWMLLPVNFQDCRASNARTEERVPVVIRSLDQASTTYLQHHCAPMQCMASEQKSEPGSLCDPPFDRNWGCPCCGHTPTAHQDLRLS